MSVYVRKTLPRLLGSVLVEPALFYFWVIPAGTLIAPVPRRNRVLDHQFRQSGQR